MNLGLEGRVALVGGASRGLGRAVAEEPVADVFAEHFGRLDILVANAGGPPAGGFESFDAEDWRRATALVLASTVELATAAAPHMRRGG